jgi:release factor glutamine methyltransferase
LVAHALRLVRAGSVVLDLCCGSGALGAAIARGAGPIELHACDVDPAAVRCARRNLAGLAEVREGDLFDALPPELRGRIDVLIANVPYVPTAEIGLLPGEARDHEPRRALDGGADGLDVQRRVAEQAAGWLASGGSVLVEVSDGQAAAAAAAFTGGGLTARIARSEEFDIDVVIGVK